MTLPDGDPPEHIPIPPKGKTFVGYTVERVRQGVNIHVALRGLSLSEMHDALARQDTHECHRVFGGLLLDYGAVLLIGEGLDPHEMMGTRLDIHGHTEGEGDPFDPA